MKKELDDSEANHISERLNNLGKYFIIPESLKSLDEEKQYELAIKTSGKYITHIMEKAGIDLDSMIYYIGLQIITQEITEKVVIDYYTFEKIFSKIYFLTVKYKGKYLNIELTLNEKDEIGKYKKLNNDINFSIP